VIADDPQLTVRLVKGGSPQPVILDSMLHFPLSSRLFARTDHAPWIFHAESAPAAKIKELKSRAARLFPVPAGNAGLSLEDVLRTLKRNGIRSLMVEGGARVLRSFIQCRLAQQAVITVSPISMNGVHVFEKDIKEETQLHFEETSCEKYGVDTVVWGKFASERA